jgi:uncharacterized protein
MPVKKTVKRPSTTKSHDCCFSGACHMGMLHKTHLDDFGKKIIWTLFGMLLVYLIVFVGTLVQKTLKETTYIGRSDSIERTITVTGSGKTTARPDIAFTTMGVITRAESVDAAQDENSEKMNTLIARLLEIGVGEEDIQTQNYNVFPDYDYTPDDGQILRGYQVDQTVRIKIRDLTSADSILALAGEVGANNVGGLDFTLDDTDAYFAQARRDALRDVNQKAKELASVLGVRLVSVVQYNESPGSVRYDQVYALRSLEMGGDIPQVESGEEEIELSVSVVFEIE